MFTMTPLEQEAVYLSLLVSGWAVAGSLPFGLACAWLLARCDFPGKAAVAFPLMVSSIRLPLMAPGVLTGVILAFALLKAVTVARADIADHPPSVSLASGTEKSHV